MSSKGKRRKTAAERAQEEAALWLELERIRPIPRKQAEARRNARKRKS